MRSRDFPSALAFSRWEETEKTATQAIAFYVRSIAALGFSIPLFMLGSFTRGGKRSKSW